MAVTNNEVIGVSECGVCGQQATYHVQRRGKGNRLVYKRCPKDGERGCTASQNSGLEKQLIFKYDLKPRQGFEEFSIDALPAGYEHLYRFTDRGAPIGCEQPEEPSGDAVPEPKREPEKEPNEQPKEAGNAGVLGLLVLGVVSTVVVIAKAARGGA